MLLHGRLLTDPSMQSTSRQIYGYVIIDIIFYIIVLLVVAQPGLTHVSEQPNIVSIAVLNHVGPGVVLEEKGNVDGEQEEENGR